MNTEIWKPVVGYEWRYEVSNLWRVKSIGYYVRKWRWWDNQKIYKSKFLTPNKWKRGYYTIKLPKKWKRVTSTLHRIIAIAFIQNPENKPHINHIDWNKLNNCVENLEWCTHTENMSHLFNILWYKPKQDIFKNTVKRTSKKVIWYIWNSSFIFLSMSDAYRKTWVSISWISRCCSWKIRKSWGYFWSYYVKS